MRTLTITRLAIACLLVVLTAGICQAVLAQVGFQGQLKEDGSNLTGFRTVTFSIWSSDAGGDPADALWHESQAVEVMDGVYNANLGADVSIPVDLYTYPELFLQVDVLHPSLGSQRLEPLLAFSSTLLAVQAAHADDAGTIDGRTIADLNTDYVNAGEADAVTSAMVASYAVPTRRSTPMRWIQTRLPTAV